MRVVWTDRAKARLHEIHAHVAQDQQLNADRVVDRLTRRVEQVIQFPESGRIMERYRREGLRELIEPPHHIVYRILADRIDIVTVRDLRRVMPRRPEDL